MVMTRAELLVLQEAADLLRLAQEVYSEGDDPSAWEYAHQTEVLYRFRRQNRT
jgi:hypothetical protein